MKTKHNTVLIPTGLITHVSEALLPRILNGKLLSVFRLFLGSFWLSVNIFILNLSSSFGQLANNLPPLNYLLRIIAHGLLLSFPQLGILFMPESLRWLAAEDRYDDVRRTLAQLRDLDESDPAITLEMEEIQAAIDAERAGSGRKFTEITQPINMKRLFIGIMLQTFQQWTGTNAINYYGPTIFRSIGIQSTEVDVLATGVYGVVKVAFVFVR